MRGRLPVERGDEGDARLGRTLNAPIRMGRRPESRLLRRSLRVRGTRSRVGVQLRGRLGPPSLVGVRVREKSAHVLVNRFSRRRSRVGGLETDRRRGQLVV